MDPPSVSPAELETKIARLISEEQLVGFRIHGEYIVRENPDVDIGEIAISILNNVVSSS